MRSALLFVLFIISTQKPLSRADDSFRPTPIPLNYWQFEAQDGRDARSINYETEAPTTAIVPAHYWEDALRHSVYLTLVRDKIDQLIARGEFISPHIKQGSNITREDDDHDLWDKIKRAPFERVEAEAPSPFGDVAIMSKGRLVEDNGAFKFTEDDRNSEKCDNHTCTNDVKAFWSVKRIRQKDAEPGRYHYELTFSVLTKEIPKKVMKPYDNPTRTFTVRESLPATILDKPHEHQLEPVWVQTQPRPNRAIWFHKNISPSQARHYQQNSLDRLFSSLFTDDDYDVVRYKTKPSQQSQQPQQTYVPQTYTQYSKISYVGAPTEQHQQKKLMPYPYKTHSMRYSRPHVPQPPVPHPHHYLDTDAIGVVSVPYMPNYQDHKHIQPPGKPLKPGRPSVIPTSLPTYPSRPNATFETSTYVAADDSSSTGSVVSSTRAPEIVTAYTPSENNNGWPLSPHEDERPPPLQQSYQIFDKPIYGKTKPNTQVKVSYFPEHVRPPVYNAPPGVFVTMDKKPFKPMPPLRLVQSKPVKTHKPVDFRPSPQVLDVQQFAEPDPLKDSFRPITGNYENSSTESETVSEFETEKQKVVVTESSKPTEHVHKHQRKHVKKHHKHSQIQAFAATAAPEIITAKTSSEEEKDTIEWANVLGAFSKTTPMASAERERPKEAETTTTPMPTTTTTKATTRRTTTTTEAPTTSTTTAPPKRTRPPPKFTKPPKVKKHKRVTSTTTKAPEKEKFTPKRPAHDLTPQASSAAASKASTKWTPSTTSTTSTTTKPPTTTTAKTTTTTTEAPTTVSSTEQPKLTPKPKNKNRYRQSTLMTKGTSVNHDKWSAPSAIESKTRTVIPPTGNFPPRRKGSNFQGYYTSSTAAAYDDDEEDYEEIILPYVTPKLSSTTEAIIVSTKAEKQEAVSLVKTTQATYEETADQYESVSERQKHDDEDEDLDEEDKENQSNEDADQEDEQESKDRNEFMFYTTSTTSPSDRTNEIADNEEPLATEQTVIASSHSVPKNKTKCKKKLTTTTEEPDVTEEEDDKSTTTSERISSPSEEKKTLELLDEIFGGFTFDEPQERSANDTKSTEQSKLEDPEEEGSKHHTNFKKFEDFEDFLDELEEKDSSESNNEDSFYSEDEKDAQESNYDDEDEKESKRASDDMLEHSPFSLLELMAME